MRHGRVGLHGLGVIYIGPSADHGPDDVQGQAAALRPNGGMQLEDRRQ